METKELLKSTGFRFNKAYGQNFITDSNLLSAIVRDAGITAEDTVLEVGPGAGTLTRILAETAKRVVAYEIDVNLTGALAEALSGADNAEVVFQDILKATDGEIREKTGGDYKVVANLPYYITTPVLMKFLEGAVLPKSITVMVQKEVADRFTAKPGSPEYGAVTVAIDSRGDARKTRTVSRKLFYPEPNVDSALVRIDVYEKYPIEDFAFFQKVYQSAFAMRRKTLVNNLTAAFPISRQQAEAAVCKAGEAVAVRGERLSTEAFLRLYEALKNI